MKLNKKAEMSETTIMGLGLGAFFLVVVGLVMAFSSFYIINDGQVGVYSKLGNFDNNEVYSGLHFKAPLITDVYKVDVRDRNILETATILAKDDLMLTVDVSVIYKIRSDRASEILQEVSGNIVNTKLIPYLRSAIRDVISGYDSSEAHSQEGRQEVALKIQEFLEIKLGKDLVIVDVLLRDVKLPLKVTEAIEDKLDAQQKAHKKEFELLSAVKDAEIEVARAIGIAEANEIIAHSLTKEYLQYKFIEGLNDGNTEVIYIPTEANMPILEVKP